MFVSLEFWLFTACVLVLYQLIPGKWQNLLLLVASYTIYAYLEPRFVLLLAGMTLFNFWMGRLINASSHRKLYFCAAVMVNVGILAFFKYALGLSHIIAPLLTKLGVTNELLITELLFPLGLSFYSFRALAYIFDVNNSQLQPENNLIDLGLYIAFFPQIVSGPIVRPQPFLNALKSTHRITQEQFVDGLTFIFMGVFYKVAIADPLFNGAQLTVPAIQGLNSVQAWSELIRYSVRIYADFAGYSLLALGVTLWFGLPFVQNFRQPYFSCTISEFWDRWHISLSSWIRDYIFYPVSRSLLRRWGNQHARKIQVTAFLVSMTLSGMWHGTGLKFMAWGVLHGVYLSIERVFFPRIRMKPKNIPHRRLLARAIIGWVITLGAVSFAWIFFRVESLTGVWEFMKRLVSSNPFLYITPLDVTKILVPIVLLLIIDLPQALIDGPLFLWRIRFAWRVAFCACFLIAIFIMGSQVYAPFVYSGF